MSIKGYTQLEHVQAEIRDRAYFKWEAAGKPSDQGDQFWTEAERELVEDMAKRKTKAKAKVAANKKAKKVIKKKAAVKKAAKKTTATKKKTAARKKAVKKTAKKSTTASILEAARKVLTGSAETKEVSVKTPKPKEKKKPSLADAAALLKQRSDNNDHYREVYRTKNMHVVEFDPQVRVFKMQLHQKNHLYYLAMPYMQFTRVLWDGSDGFTRGHQAGGRPCTTMHVSITNKPINKIEDTVYFPPLPNVWYPDLQLCFMSCPQNNLMHMMNYFWNTDYLDCEDWYCFPVLDKETPMRTYQNWQKMTKKDPEFVLGVEWTQPAVISEIPSGNFSNNVNTSFGGSTVNRHTGVRGFAVCGDHKPLD